VSNKDLLSEPAVDNQSAKYNSNSASKLKKHVTFGVENSNYKAQRYNDRLKYISNNQSSIIDRFYNILSLPFLSSLYELFDKLTSDIDYFIDSDSFHGITKYGKTATYTFVILVSLLIHIIGRLMFGKHSIFFVIIIGVVGMRWLKYRSTTIASTIDIITQVIIYYKYCNLSYFVITRILRKLNLLCIISSQNN
jgi:hypothetical protein